MGEKDIKVRQHFVPRFYLKNFADSAGNVQIVDIQNKRLAKPKHYGSAGFEKFYYAATTGVGDEASQQVEDWLEAIETPIAQELPRIVSVILNNQQISEDDRYTLSVLMSLLWLRSPYMRDHLAQMETDLRKQLLRLHAPEKLEQFMTETGTILTGDQRQQLLEMLNRGAFTFKFNNVQHLRFMVEHLGAGSAGFANMFFGMRWRIYLAKGQERFVTTDSPVIEWFLPPTTFYGTSFLYRNKYFALTPDILIEALPPPVSEHAKHAKRITLYADRDREVKTYNMLLVSHAKEYAYTGDRRIANWLITAAKQPGPLELAYYEKYERPWAEHRARRQRPRGAA
jgi:hypothetical protein